MMWLAFYNPVGIGDVLLLMSEPVPREEIKYVTNGQVTALVDKCHEQIVGYNLFGVAQLNLNGQGAVTLDAETLAQVNAKIQAAGFTTLVTVDAREKFVVGYVETCQEHPDSDHLHVTQTRVGDDEVLQIVCGASNIKQGQSVIVAKPGAVMPNGLIIWPGALRGVESQGMICSTRELGLEAIANEPGIWVLPTKEAPGTPLATVVVKYQ